MAALEPERARRNLFLWQNADLDPAAVPQISVGRTHDLILADGSHIVEIAADRRERPGLRLRILERIGPEIVRPAIFLRGFNEGLARAGHQIVVEITVAQV